MASDNVGDMVALALTVDSSVARASPKSSKFHHAFRRHFDVRRFQVAMDYALLVRRLEARRDLARILNRRLDGNRTGQVGTLHQFHDQSALLHPVHRRDVGMVERGQQLGFRSKRAMRPASDAKAEGRTLMATSRPSLVSVAR